MKTTIACVLIFCMFVGIANGFKAVGKGENQPTVQSAFNGAYYIRSVPTEDFGTKGITQIFKVDRKSDKLLDEYPKYMRGELFLGWSPLKGQWALVHLQPERITSNNDYHKIGAISELAFYIGGRLLRSYSTEELTKLGLIKHVGTLVYKRPGDFIVNGIEQIPGTNNYVFVMSKIEEKYVESKILIDITSGLLFEPKE